MSDPKYPKSFEDQDDDAEATIMAPGMGQNFSIPGPPPGHPGQATPPPPSAPPLTPPPASYTPPPTTYPPRGQTGGFTPPGYGGPPSSPSHIPPAPTQVDAPGPFVQQGRPAPQLSPEEERTRMLGGDEDIHSEATMVVGGIDSNLIIPMAKLVILEGIQKNKEYPLLGKEVSFGREKDNAISYPDLSVSRHHFKIHCSKDKFELEDLGSGNGTALNGSKVKGTVPIKHGDQIRVGKSIIQFLLIGKDIAPIGGLQKQSSNTLVIALLSLFLVLGGIAVAAFMLKTPPIKDDKPARVQAEIKRGVKLRSQGKLQDAMLTFRGALQIMPNHLGAKQLLDDTTADITTSHYLRKAKFMVQQASLVKGKADKIKVYKSAKRSLDKLERSMPPGSKFAPKVWALLSKVNTGLSALEEPKPGPGPAVPPSVRPVEWGDKRKSACRRKCKGKRKRCRRFRRKINGKRIRRWLCVKRGEKPPKPPKVVTPPVVREKTPSQSKFALAEKMYIGGNAQGAAKAFALAGDAGRSKKILQFIKIFFKSRADYQSYNPARAIPSLRKALRLDYSIGEGKRSVFTRQLRQMLANMYFSKGLILMNRQSYANAFGNFKKALDTQKKHPNTLKKIRELSNKAKQWLQKGKDMLKSDPGQAKQFFRKVRRITFRSDPVRKEAEKLLR